MNVSACVQAGVRHLVDLPRCLTAEVPRRGSRQRLIAIRTFCTARGSEWWSSTIAKELEDHSSVGDLSGYRKVYFDETDDRNPATASSTGYYPTRSPQSRWRPSSSACVPQCRYTSTPPGALDDSLATRPLPPTTDRLLHGIQAERTTLKPDYRCSSLIRDQAAVFAGVHHVLLTRVVIVLATVAGELFVPDGADEQLECCRPGVLSMPSPWPGGRLARWRSQCTALAADALLRPLTSSRWPTACWPTRARPMAMRRRVSTS